MNTELGYNKATLLSMLENRVVEVKFYKENGDLRILQGTLSEALLPEVEKDRMPDQSQENLVVVWDVVAEGWRSIRTDRVLEVF